jgi:electron transfer flavoprotein beta subunit
MKIAVCVKAVPSGAGGRRIDATTKRLDRSGDLAISDFDLHPVEEALRIREAAGEGEVVVLTLAPARASDALRKTLAMGADRAVLISDESFAGADLVVTAHALAAALEREQADLVLFGQQSADGDGACLWAAVAEILKRPAISQVAELSVEGAAVTGRRQTEFGYERIRAPLPAVLAVSDAINEPRYPPLKGIMSAKTKPQDSLAAAELGGAKSPLTTVLAVNLPPARGDKRTVEGDGASEAILEFLVEKRFV